MKNNLKYLVLGIVFMFVLVGAIQITNFNNESSPKNIVFFTNQWHNTYQTSGAFYTTLLNSSGNEYTRAIQGNLTFDSQYLQNISIKLAKLNEYVSGNLSIKIRNSTDDNIISECNIGYANDTFISTGLYSGEYYECDFGGLFLDGLVFFSIERDNITDGGIQIFGYDEEEIEGAVYRYNNITGLWGSPAGGGAQDLAMIVTLDEKYNISLYNNANVTSANMNLTGYSDAGISGCYQESANTTDQTGLDGDCGINYSGTYYYDDGDGFFGGSGDRYLMIDGDWGTSIYNQRLLINYTKPINKTGAIWKIKDNGGETNLTIPEDCWNAYTDNISLKMLSTGGGFDWYSSSQCYNGTGWITLNSISLGEDRNTIYEEAIFWGDHIENLNITANNTSIFQNNGKMNDSNSPNITNDFSEILNTALNSGNCDCVGCSLSENNCTIPFYFHSDTSGVLGISDMNITWFEYSAPTIEITEPNGEKVSTNISYEVNVTDDWQSDFCTYWVTRGASIEVANTSVTCSDSISGTLYVSSVGTNYTFHFFANDTSGNSNYSNSSFSTSSGAVIVLPPSPGGGGGTTTVVDNGISFNMFASGGGSSFTTKVILGTSRELEILYENLVGESITLKMSCEDITGDACKYVTFPEETFSLPLITGAKTSKPFNIIVPENAELGNYLFNIVATDETSKKGRISVDLTISQSGIFNKLSSRTESGFPYFLIFLASLVPVFIFSMILFKKAKIRLLISIFISVGISSIILYLI